MLFKEIVIEMRYIGMKRVNINVSVPREIILTLRETNEEFTLVMKRYTAMKLFQDGRLSIGQSAEFAEMTEEEFIKLLGKNKISIFDYHDLKSLKEDMMLIYIINTF